MADKKKDIEDKKKPVPGSLADPKRDEEELTAVKATPPPKGKTLVRSRGPDGNYMFTYE